MSLEDLAGTWEGFYTYGPDYPEQYQTVKERFVLALTVNEGIITGTCVDTFTQKYFSEPATVEGTLVDQSVSLVKKYPYFLGVDENEEVFVDKSKPSHDIHYIGLLKRKLFSNHFFVEGTWDMSGSFRDEHGNAQYYTQEGEWEMRRVK